MRSVYLAGYYGMRNTGDDALLAAAAWGVRRFLAPERVFVNVARLPEFPGAHELVPVYREQESFRFENRLRGYLAGLRSQSMVYGGGSLFHSAAGIGSNINQLRLAGRGPHYAVGVGLGPFKNRADERACADFLARLAFVGVRDRESLEIARALAPGVASRKTFDLAALLPLAAGGLPGGGGSSDMAASDVAAGKGTGNCGASPPAGYGARRASRRGVGFALCHYERHSGGDPARDARRQRKLAAALALLDPDQVDEVVFIDFNGHPHLGDRELHRELASGLAGRFAVRHVPYSPNPAAVLNEIASLRLVVAMRLHAAVFGYLAQTPTVMLSYHPKCRGWAEEIGLPGRFLLNSAEFDPGHLAQAIGETLSRPDQGIALPVACAQRLALSNWQFD